MKFVKRYLEFNRTLFFQSDLFGTVAGLSQEDKRQISHQRVATFEEVLHIVKESNTSFVFDRTFKGEQIHPYAEKANQIFIDLIEEVGLNPRKVNLLGEI